MRLAQSGPAKTGMTPIAINCFVSFAPLRTSIVVNVKLCYTRTINDIWQSFSWFSFIYRFPDSVKLSEQKRAVK